MRWDSHRFSAFLLAQLLLALCASLFAFQPAAAADQAVVFVVHSYEKNYVWTQNIDKGLHQALSGLDVSFQTFYMNAKIAPDPERLKDRAQEILARIEAERPRVVITSDDAAQTYLAAPHLKGRAEPQVIFCGVNAPLSTYGSPAANVSGVRERWHIREGLALLKRIKPALRSAVMLTDGSESSDYILNSLAQERNRNLALKLVTTERPRTFQQWQSFVRRYQGRVDALALGINSSLVDETTGKVVPTDEVAAWTNSVNRLPTIGFADASARQGHLCGILTSGEEQGQLAGAMARQVLEQGVSAGTLPVRMNQKGVVLVNLKTAERLNITIPYEIISAAGVLVK
jgi:ABC-type uncharacterized transport system, periplasmic component